MTVVFYVKDDGKRYYTGCIKNMPKNKRGWLSLAAPPIFQLSFTIVKIETIKGVVMLRVRDVLQKHNYWLSVGSIEDLLRKLQCKYIEPNKGKYAVRATIIKTGTIYTLKLL